jgi:hypothetical protein
MLPPFEIRNLRRLQNPLDSVPRNHDRLSSSSSLGSRVSDNGIIQIEASFYNPLMSQFPEAALSYMDDDDGEVITVSSFYYCIRDICSSEAD